MSNVNNENPASGRLNGATITIQQQPEGLAIGLEFHGENIGENEREAMKALALAGVEAMRDWIHERYSVRSEELHRRSDHEGKKPSTH